MTRGKPLSFDRQQVLGKAMDLFWSRGYESTGMTELLDRMGIQRQSLYNTFGNKQDVFIAALDMYTSRLVAQIKQRLTQSDDPVRNLESVFSFWEEQMKAHPGTGCLLGNAVAEFGSENEAVSTFCRRKIAEVENAFTDVFQQAIDRRQLPSERNARALARTMITISQGLALLSKTGMKRAAMRDVVETARRALFS